MNYNKNYDFVFYKVKGSKKFLNKVKNLSTITHHLIEDINESKRKNILFKSLMNKIRENNREIEYYMNILLKILPSVDRELLSMNNGTMSEKIEKVDSKNLSNNKELDIDSLKKELEKIEKELLKLSIK